jgi:5-methyltetrahydrofolate--homocysteine methyltransferase
MKSKEAIRRLLKKNILILDGATGTELQKRGMPGGVCPELWCLEHPAVLEDIHRAYRQAGADIVYTCTFGANRYKLAQYGRQEVREINRELARLARRAVGPRGLVAGDIGPTGHFVEPFGDLPFEEAVAAFSEQVRGLAEGGVDLFAIETMMDIQEARAALLAVKETCPAFTIVTLTYENGGRTLNGTDPVSALITLQSLGADAVGCNCSTGPETMLTLIQAMKPFATVPLAAKPNAGLPRLEGEETFFDMDAASFAQHGPTFAAAGVNLLGGCCGTTPDHIRSLAETLRNAAPRPPVRTALSAVSSARSFRLLERNKPLVIVGERLNPTGKKALQQELLAGRMSLVRQMTREQEQQQADLLDVNVGVPGIDEEKAIREVLALLATTTELPLVIDSAKVETVETALRLYPGRALINSISGEKEKCERLLPLAARYGAMFILLPLADGEVPETADRRIAIVRDVYGKARRFGFTKEDIVIDGLVMTAATNAHAPAETLKTIAWCANRFMAKTILGISNVSFGLPERKWLNAAFLAMAQLSGLTMAIANPSMEEIMAIKRASDVLTANDAQAAAYIAHFAKIAEGQGATALQATPPSGAQSPEEKIRAAVLEGNQDDITELVENALTAGGEARSIIDDLLIPAIIQVGELFDRKRYFLPQLIASAEAMKKALTVLEPRLQSSGITKKAKGTIVMATVQGDIHDIGKNIVVLMLKNHGYQVLDLGKDVPTERLLETIRTENPDVVGLSALMTTTMVSMKTAIEEARKEGLSCPFLIGGAVVTRSYADSIGAAYARDGVEAVRVVEQLLRKAKQGILE